MSVTDSKFMTGDEPRMRGSRERPSGEVAASEDEDRRRKSGRTETGTRKRKRGEGKVEFVKDL
jgi:hypothetical protein